MNQFITNQPSSIHPFKSDKIQQDLLYYNRVPKTGSENLGYLLEELAKRNNFTQSRCYKPSDRKLTKENQRAHVLDINKAPRPFSYHKHVYFINFETFGQKNPIWISMVRNPVEKLISRYYYNRNEKTYNKLMQKNSINVAGLTESEWESNTADQCIEKLLPECHFRIGTPRPENTIPYFCGQEDECLLVGSKWAFNQAKHNLETWYTVVGVLEHFNLTLTVFEAFIPQFFRNVSALYPSLGEPHVNKNSHHTITEANRRTLMTNLTLEMDFYEFVVQRFFAQLYETQKQ
ncbi:heparan sulfate 2-O-sulfotransferase pipe-like [Tigriopus californicus]|uniref:heparan sulfate 2-O-sulfotransferase pipe-like n=1 Tax=Tigriopus californicus TaxID=6832 RepID=UPI0027D9F78F|nr:heparan sulfate 2-O-sulfotransferase pipe-like [Tigriopus californicus]